MAQVVGVESAPEAINAFRKRFPELQVPYEPQRGVHDGFERFLAGDLMLYRGDFLDVSPVVLSLAGPVGCIWDRAALDILPEEVWRIYLGALVICGGSTLAFSRLR
jgi:hypothetical protein